MSDFNSMEFDAKAGQEFVVERISAAASVELAQIYDDVQFANFQHVAKKPTNLEMVQCTHMVELSPQQPKAKFKIEKAGHYQIVFTGSHGAYRLEPL